MGWFSDLKSIPGDFQANSALREQVKLWEDQYKFKVEQNDALKATNADLNGRIRELSAEVDALQKQIPSGEDSVSLSDGDTDVLLHLYRVKGQRHEGRPFEDIMQPNDIRAMAPALALDAARLQYHLDRLEKIGFAVPVSGTTDGGVHWSLTDIGIAHAIENDLV